MRLLQLSLESGEHAALDLHPLLSVVQGLDERARDRLVRTVAAIAAGVEPPCAGMAEAHGVMLPLDEANMALLDLRTEADPIVRRGDLPGAVGDGSESAVDRLRGPGRRPAAQRTRRGAPRARRRPPSPPRHPRGPPGPARDVRRHRPPAHRGRRGAPPPERRHRRAPPSARTASSPTSTRWPPSKSDLAALDAGIAELTALDLEPVRVLLDAIENPEPLHDVPHPAAQALAAEIVRLHGEVADLEARMEAEGRGPVTALARLDAARIEAQAAELALTRPPVSSDDEEELRQAHEVVLDAEQQGLRLPLPFRASASSPPPSPCSRRSSTGSATRPGAPMSWAPASWGSTSRPRPASNGPRPSSPPPRRRGSTSPPSSTTTPTTTPCSTSSRTSRSRPSACSSSAGRRSPTSARTSSRSLRELTVPADSASEDDLVATLVHSLHNLGLQVDHSQPERVLVTAHALLEEFAGVPARVEELTAERRRLESQLADARSRAEAKAWEDLEAAVDRPATERIAEIEAELVAARAAEEDLAEALEGRQALVEAATLAERAASRRARAAGLAVLEHERRRRPRPRPAVVRGRPRGDRALPDGPPVGDP